MSAAGLRFHVQQLGPVAKGRAGGEEAAPPVVMLHGLVTGNVATWYVTAAPQLAKLRRVYLYDLRGHGRSERPAGGYGPVSMLEDLACLRLAWGIDDCPVDLVGHSYGGLVALCYAMAHPSRVRRLALVEAPLPPLAVPDLSVRRDHSDVAVAQSLPLPEVVRHALCREGRRKRRFWDAVRSLLSETTLLSDLAQAAHIDEAALGRLPVPTLLIYGQSSELAPTGERLLHALRDAELARLPGGHFLHVEARDALTGALHRFLCDTTEIRGDIAS